MAGKAFKGRNLWLMGACVFALHVTPGSAAPPGPVSTGPTAGTVDEVPTSRVTSAVELDRLLRQDPPFKGRILIPKDARWTMEDPCGGRDEFGSCVTTPLVNIPVRSSVQILGERGYLGSRPVLHSRLKTEGSVFVVTGNDVRIEGLHLAGPKPTSDHAKREPFFTAIHVVEDHAAGLGRRVLIADNELQQWSGGGVLLAGARYSVLPKDWQAEVGSTPPGRESAAFVHVERNYIHDNAMDGAGYGIKVTGGGWGTIEGNVFDTNRHVVEGLGYAYSGYTARFNYVLQGGVKQGCCWNQHFDVHGTGSGGYGGYAGEYFEVAFNTIRGEQEHSAGFKTRPAFMVRGRPAQGAYFSGNVAVHDDLDEAVSLKMEQNDTGFGEDQDAHNFHAGGNRFDVDYSTEIASGDFDGDGFTDVFVANGTAWFYSRAGIRAWQYLRASNKRTGELGFADIDNDKATDVLYRASDGKLGYIKGGRGDLLPLTSTPVPIKDLRFGDFDGDGRTDIFLTRGGDWKVWYGSTRTWKIAGSSGKSIADLLFGEFDDVRGTDIAGVNSPGWVFSSAATQPWSRLNGKLTKSFDDAVAADFDGNGKTDIAVGDGEKWRISRDGRAPLAALRSGRSSPNYPDLKRLLIGRFDGSPRAQALTFLRVFKFGGWAPAERFVMWRGLGTSADFVTRSHQNMR